METNSVSVPGSNRFTINQFSADLLRPGTNFETPDPRLSNIDRSINGNANQLNILQERVNTGTTTRRFPLITTLIEQALASQSGIESTTSLLNTRGSQPTTFIQTVSDNIGPSLVDVGQFPGLQQVIPVRQPAGRNFVAITSNLPFSSSFVQGTPDASVIAVVPTIQQAVDAGGLGNFFGQNSLPETVLTETGALKRVGRCSINYFSFSFVQY